MNRAAVRCRPTHDHFVAFVGRNSEVHDLVDRVADVEQKAFASEEKQKQVQRVKLGRSKVLHHSEGARPVKIDRVPDGQELFAVLDHFRVEPLKRVFQKLFDVSKVDDGPGPGLQRRGGALRGRGVGRGCRLRLCRGLRLGLRIACLCCFRLRVLEQPGGGLCPGRRVCLFELEVAEEVGGADEGNPVAEVDQVLSPVGEQDCAREGSVGGLHLLELLREKRVLAVDARLRFAFLFDFQDFLVRLQFQVEEKKLRVLRCALGLRRGFEGRFVRDLLMNLCSRIDSLRLKILLSIAGAFEGSRSAFPLESASRLRST